MFNLFFKTDERPNGDRREQSEPSQRSTLARRMHLDRHRPSRKKDPSGLQPVLPATGLRVQWHTFRNWQGQKAHLFVAFVSLVASRKRLSCGAEGRGIRNSSESFATIVRTLKKRLGTCSTWSISPIHRTRTWASARRSKLVSGTRKKKQFGNWVKCCFSPGSFYRCTKKMKHCTSAIRRLF